MSMYAAFKTEVSVWHLERVLINDVIGTLIDQVIYLIGIVHLRGIQLIQSSHLMILKCCLDQGYLLLANFVQFVLTAVLPLLKC